jgi:hypothetical protein
VIAATAVLEYWADRTVRDVKEAATLDFGKILAGSRKDRLPVKRLIPNEVGPISFFSGPEVFSE